MKTEVFKIQRQVGAPRRYARILIYNEDRSVTVQLSSPPRGLRRMLGRNMLKIYVEGFVDENGILHIEQQVTDKEW